MKPPTSFLILHDKGLLQICAGPVFVVIWTRVIFVISRSKQINRSLTMSWDISDTDSYYRTSEGILVADILAADLSKHYRAGRIRELADTADQLAVGYPFPLYPHTKPLPAVFMLAETGVLAWTGDQGVITACVDSGSFPCATDVFEQVFVSHALEHVADKVGFLSEIWRCLKGEGELLMIVPHRRSLWARADKTPFGQGTPLANAN